MKKELTYVATCLLGVEGLVANELKFMGAKEVTPENGRVIFKGDYNILARANICSRYAERIMILLGTFYARTFEELFNGVSKIKWSEYIDKDDNFPVKGKGTHSYKTSSGLECSFDYGSTTFSWNEMRSQYVGGNYTTEEANAVAELMHACGVAVDMEYSPSSSGAYSFKVGQALIDYFGYDENLGYVCRQYFTSEEWINMIKTELSERRPVLYNGASKDVGHEFVFDGYDSQDMVHVNWGWGGLNNGYFEVVSLDPSSPGIGGGTNLGGGFIYQQGMLIGLQPPIASSNYTSHFHLAKLEVSKEEVSKGEKFDLTVTDM